MAIEDVLATWLGDQRWFAGKGQGLHDLAIVADTELVAGEPGLRHLIVAATHGTAVDYYQILVGLRRRLPVRLQHVRIGPSGDGRIAYDALHDAELTKPLLAGIAAGSEGRAAADGDDLRRQLRDRARQPGARRRAEQHQPCLRRRVDTQGVPQALPWSQPGPRGDHGARPPRLGADRRAARLHRDQPRGRDHQPGHPVALPAAGHRRLDARRHQRARPVREGGRHQPDRRGPREHPRGRRGRRLRRRIAQARHRHRGGARGPGRGLRHRGTRPGRDGRAERADVPQARPHRRRGARTRQAQPT